MPVLGADYDVLGWLRTPENERPVDSAAGSGFFFSSDYAGYELNKEGLDYCGRLKDGIEEL